MDSNDSSFNTTNERATVSGGLGNLGYFVNYGNKKSDGYLLSNYNYGNDYSGRLDYALPANGRISTSFKHSEIELGYPVVNDPNSKYYNPDYPIVLEDADVIRSFRLLSYPGGKSYKHKQASHLDFDYEQPIGKKILQTFKFWRDTGGEDSYSYQMNLTTKKLSQSFSGGPQRRERTFGGLLEYQLNLWARNQMTIGYSQRRMDVEQGPNGLPTPDIWRVQAAYVDDQLSLTPKLTLNLGSRFLWVREYSLYYIAPGETVSSRHLIHSAFWLPKFTLGYRFTPVTEGYVSINRDYHLPNC